MRTLLKKSINNSAIIFALFSALLFVACKPENRKINSREQKEIIREENNWIAGCDTLPTMVFRKIFVSDSNVLAVIRNDYKYSDPESAEHKILTTLNRKEFRFIRINDTIVVPGIVSDNITDYSLFPACYPEARHLPKIVVVSNKYQCYACYEDGKLIHYAAVNTGSEKSQTYPGRYYMTWKQLDHRSSLDSNWHMPYTINFHLQAGNAFHQFTMPGRPVSHSCIRQFRRDAKWLYEWSDRAKFDTCRNVIRNGTMVLVLDAFDFGRKRFGPWLDLMSNKEAEIQLPANPENYELPFIPIEQIPRGARERLPGGYERYKYAEDTLRARGIIRSHVQISHSFNRNEHRRKLEREKQLIEQQKQNAEQPEATTTEPENLINTEE